MAEATTVENGNSESSRTQRSKRDFLGADGSVVKRMEEATGARYSVFHDGQITNSFDRQFGEAGVAATMFAVFGFHTKCGNVLNTIVNADDYDGKDPSAGVEAWLDLMDSDEPQWSERKAGVGSRTKFDKDIWAQVLAAQPAATMGAAEYREKLDTDASWYAKVRARASLLQQYYEYVGADSEGDDSDLL